MFLFHVETNTFSNLYIFPYHFPDHFPYDGIYMFLFHVETNTFSRPFSGKSICFYDMIPNYVFSIGEIQKQIQKQIQRWVHGLIHIR